MKISVSFLGSNNIPYTISELDKTDVDLIHVDVMDGKYVKNKTMSFSSLKDIGYYTQKRLDIHFMVKKPLKYIDDYASLNVFCMSFHLDIKDDLDKVINRCHDYGIKVGLVLNPEDDIEKVFPYLDKIDLILIMSVVPGLPGQEMIMETLAKVKALREKITKENRQVLLSIDGGVNLTNRAYLDELDIIVSGSFITKSVNYQETINKLRYNLPNERKIIGIDLDDTITDIRDEMHYIAQKYDQHINGKGIVEPNKYSVGDKYQWSDEQRDDFLKNYRIKVVEKAQIRPHAKEVLQSFIEDGYEVVIITARSFKYYDDPYNYTKDWLDKNHLPYTKLLVNVLDKKKVCEEEHVTIFVDDMPKNCEEVSKNSNIKVYIMDNVDNYTDNELITRVKGFDELDKKIRSL